MDAALVGSIAEIIDTTATAAAVGWAVFEFHRKRVADLEQRAVEIESVSIGYRLQKPRCNEVHDGAGTHSHDFTLFNPGRLPLTDVSVSMIYPGAVRRVHGGGTVDPAQTTYETQVAAIPTAGSFAWHRDLLVPTEVMPQMRGTRADHLPNGRRRPGHDALACPAVQTLGSPPEVAFALGCRSTRLAPTGRVPVVDPSVRQDGSTT